MHALLSTGLQQLAGRAVESLVDGWGEVSVRQIMEELTPEQRPQPATSLPRPAGSPVAIKLNIFCLPYAGGVSENVYARCGAMRGVESGVFPG